MGNQGISQKIVRANVKEARAHCKVFNGAILYKDHLRFFKINFLAREDVEAIQCINDGNAVPHVSLEK